MTPKTKRTRTIPEIEADIASVNKFVDDMVADHGALTPFETYKYITLMDPLQKELEDAREWVERERKFIAYNKDENNKPATLDKWLEMLDAAIIDDARDFGDSRAVAQELHNADDAIFLNGSAAECALHNFTKDDAAAGYRNPSKDADKLYKACEASKRGETMYYKGYQWFYATPEQVADKINKEFGVKIDIHERAKNINIDDIRR